METEKKISTSRLQVLRLAEYLNTGKRITSLQAWRILGVSYLPQVIRKAKDAGFVFNERNVTVMNRHDEKCNIKQWWFDSPQQVEQ
jgi:hypothetical protein